MTKNLNNGLNEYYREINKKLSCSSKEKMRILESVKSSVECYVSENPDAKIDDIIKAIGSPKNIADEYINNQSNEEIAYKINKTKKIVMYVVIAVVIALVIYGIVIITALINDKNATDNRETTKFVDYVTITDTTEGEK